MKKRKKYAAVFSCLVLITAFGAGIAGSRSAKREQERQRSANEAILLNEEAKTVDINKNANPNGVKYNIQKENGSLKEYYQNTSTKSNDSGESPDSSDETKNTEIKENADTIKPEPQKENKTNTVTDNTSADKELSSAEDMDNEEFVLSDSDYAKPVFSPPVNGDIVMDFSSDALIYDSTLDQYRTNSNICISAPKGTAVKAAASGTVESVAFNDEDGYTVTVFHGNGWRTTYGQLDKNTAVSQGDFVKAGDVIGTVAAPTKYSLSLGEHLEFAVTEDSAAIDPKIALAE